MNTLQQQISRMRGSERGSVTAEYAIATMAAVGFAGLLVAIMRGGQVQSILFGLVKSALSLG